MELDLEILAAGLGAEAILRRTVLPRSGNVYRELVACRMPGGRLRQLLCKFGPLDVEPPPHHFGVAYEAQVYEQLLSAWQDDVPHLHGAFLDDTSQTFALAINHLEGATPLGQLPQPEAGLLAAARWIACFHRWSETAAVPPFLHRYDTDFYRTWMQRAGHFTCRLHECHPWLPDLCEQCQRRLPALLPLATIIHGEYQAGNILVYDGRNVPTEWESAALAAGEIDLASLTWGWDHDLAARCEQQYCLARWPDGPPGDYALRLVAARAFLQLRRFGNADGQQGEEETTIELEKLRPLAERLMGS